MTHAAIAEPRRIQRKRIKGYKMPAGAIYVGRPTRWGNPFRVFGENEYLYCDASHRRTILTPWVIFDQDQDIRDPATPEMAVKFYIRWLTGEFNAAGIVRPCSIETYLSIRRELRGKSLACFCPLDQPCHADALLEIANA